MGLSGFISPLLCEQPAANSFIGLYLVVYWMPACVRVCVYFAKVICAYVRVLLCRPTTASATGNAFCAFCIAEMGVNKS